jgi:putative ubiquitin-RnfH superfamily antitoxin RatB of RatAB toxin-antitoxin module
MSAIESPGSVLRDLRNVQIHGFIAFSSSVVLHKSRSTALDLDTASGFLLDVFDVGTTLTDNLSTEVESNDRFEVYGNLLLGPLALREQVRGKQRVSSEDDLRDPLNLSRPALVLCGGNVFHLQG